MDKVAILGTGSYLPERILFNSDLEKSLNISDEWITTRTGVSERRIAAPTEATSDLGYKAAKLALEDAKIDKEKIDLILVATITPDHLFPSTACLIQKKLAIHDVPAFDINAACSGFLYGISLAKAYIESGAYSHVLLIAAEKLSPFVNYQDRATCVMFGDGASACVIGKGKGLTIQSVVLGADGLHSELLILPAGGSKNPTTEETLKKDLHYLQMLGNELFKHAVRRMESACRASLEKASLPPEAISWLIPHQANERIIDSLAKRFPHLPKEKVIKVIKKYGNTSASSIGIALDELRKSHRLIEGDNLLFAAFGAGLTWASAVMTLEKQ